MSHNFLEQLESWAKEAELSEVEQRKMHSSIVTFMEQHPRAPTALPPAPIASPRRSFRLVWFSGAVGATAFVLLLLFFVSGDVLPDSPLYNLKVKGREPLSRMFIQGEAGRTRYDVVLLKRRVGEARSLAERGSLEHYIPILQKLAAAHSARARLALGADAGGKVVPEAKLFMLGTMEDQALETRGVVIDPLVLEIEMFEEELRVLLEGRASSAGK